MYSVFSLSLYLYSYVIKIKHQLLVCCGFIYLVDATGKSGTCGLFSLFYISLCVSIPSPQKIVKKTGEFSFL